MKSNREIQEALRKHGRIVSASASIVSFDTEQDTIVIEVNVVKAAPLLDIETLEVNQEDYQRLRYSRRTKLKLSEMYMLAEGQEPPVKNEDWSTQDQQGDKSERIFMTTHYKEDQGVL
jgi:hypothetical protein